MIKIKQSTHFNKNSGGPGALNVYNGFEVGNVFDLQPPGAQLKGRTHNKGENSLGLYAIKVKRHQNVASFNWNSTRVRTQFIWFYPLFTCLYHFIYSGVKKCPLSDFLVCHHT